MQGLAHASEREWLTVNETAARIRLHPVSVRRMIREGRLPAVQLGGRGAPVRVSVRELEQWLNS